MAKGWSTVPTARAAEPNIRNERLFMCVVGVCCRKRFLCSLRRAWFRVRIFLGRFVEQEGA
jgi:hypothetical protein